MFKNIIFFIFFSLFLPLYGKTQDNYNNRLFPEIESDFNLKKKVASGSEEVIVTSNKYATDLGKKILEKGGNAADAAVTVQLVLGLVEPQSSGIGGGGFALYYDEKNKTILNYDGREKAPKNIQYNVFQDKDGLPLKFFDAVFGGSSVGVPGMVDMLFNIHKDHGLLGWDDVIEPAIKLAEEGFYPPERLLKSLNNEKYLWRIEKSKKYFLKIKNNPKKIVKNQDYAQTLRKISKNHELFYEGKIAESIINTITSAPNSGNMTLEDLRNYETKKSTALCTQLNKFYFCGPNLPSSGGITLTQALLLYENYRESKKIPEFKLLLDILRFIYHERSLYLGDPAFEIIDEEKLLNPRLLVKRYNDFTQKKSIPNTKTRLNSTSHFSILDKFGNNISMTSSIENSFGSRLFVNGFLLNNQLTDFSFSGKNSYGEVSFNKVKGNKKPLSSMSPVIILNKEKEFLLSLGSPGGTAIISYVFKTLVDVMYHGLDPLESIKNGNFIRKGNKLYLEKDRFNLQEIKDLFGENIEIKEVPLTSGIGIIIKKENKYIGAADLRRDGTVFAK